ncbi:HNH endonuclease [Sorangium sp. So ce854]|uniref:HNH endonuclease n=1 Tax=Sorangium sp. So ce854 TaxID=3133322 RepID=UPI003F5EE39E
MTSKWVPTTLTESLHWSYANLAMAHAAVAKGQQRYGRLHYMIRAHFRKGLLAGTMSIGSIAEDEKLKLVLPRSCCYCGNKDSLSVDHLIPRGRGGIDAGENMVWSCRSCNSSKGKKDVLVWLKDRGRFPPLLLLRRYLKLAISISAERGLLLTPLETARDLELPFCVASIPHRYPDPSELVLWVVPLE